MSHHTSSQRFGLPIQAGWDHNPGSIPLQAPVRPNLEANITIPQPSLATNGTTVITGQESRPPTRGLGLPVFVEEKELLICHRLPYEYLPGDIITVQYPDILRLYFYQSSSSSVLPASFISPQYSKYESFPVWL